ncbi:amidohydrolase family protein [Gordonia sp. TBRC 11910]|uniref:Amidohydrolase family protein n=1 Tax=Gordonia asplenii TaxID=2725283 RepID=A0A848KRW6_9ACTN|nr:amidohydrolase family protein [Gordonia asplenii]NMO01704.1 amidohydrolase family protein [Gordonia asplenii]
MSNLLFRNGYIVSMDDAIGTIRGGDVLIRDGEITHVGGPISDLPPDTEIIDAHGGILSPGFVDTHRHCWMTCLRGLNVDHTLMEYLTFVRQNVVNLYSADDVGFGNYIGALEALDAGVTTVLDHSHNIIGPDYADAAVDGLRRSGIRAVFGYGFHDAQAEQSGFATPEDRYADAARIARELADDPLIDFGVALSETGMVPFTQTRREIEVGREHGGLITTHMACAPGLSVCAGLEQFRAGDLLGPDMVFSHGVLLDDDDIASITAAGASIACVHDSELGMGEGPVVLHKLHAHGARATFGADFAPLINGDLFGMIRLSMAVARGARHADTVAQGQLIGSVGLPMRYFLEMATRNGAAALQMDDRVGSLTPGKRGDVVLLKPHGMSMIPLPEPIEAFPLYASSANVHTVAVDGRLVKRDGQLLGVDLAAIGREAERRHEAVYSAGAREPFAMPADWREQTAQAEQIWSANLADA